MQAATGITEPDYGAIFDDMVFDNGAVIEHDRFSNVRIEVELAFVLGAPIDGPNATIFDVLRATEYVVPALEILSSRIEMAGRTIVDTISDNAAMGGLVLRRQPDSGRRRRPALGGGAALPQRDDRGVRRRRRRAEPSRDRGGVAGQQAGPARRPTGSRRESCSPDRSPAPCGCDQGDTVLADYGPMGTISCRFV